MLQKSNINNWARVIYWFLHQPEDNPTVLDRDMTKDQLSEKVFFIIVALSSTFKFLISRLFLF